MSSSWGFGAPLLIWAHHEGDGSGSRTSRSYQVANPRAMHQRRFSLVHRKSESSCAAEGEGLEGGSRRRFHECRDLLRQGD